MRFTLLTCFILMQVNLLFSQTKSTQAVKITQSIKIDGNLDDAAWQAIQPITDFIIQAPDFGKPPSRKTEVRIAYDNAAFYVGAYMYDDPSKIRRQLTSRDVVNFQDADYFAIGLDTYNDNQNGFLFQVTSAGVQGDAKVSSNSDRNWDAVWESKTSIKADGWVAEMRIPFSAIRFAKTPLQTWGMQFNRFSRTNNESITWAPEDPQISGSINQWGEYVGLKDIVPPLRLSFLPYLSGGIKLSPTSRGTVTEYTKSGGMDVKYGINESFTLDMTLIPDFAQVQSDNVILNLSPFEVRFDEYRPFFTEGTELFNKAGLFYSRRIGKQPGGTGEVLSFVRNNPDYEIVRNPGISKLYNATKISGRTRKNLGIGVFNALSAQMEATLSNRRTKSDSIIITEPLTNYNIIVLDQAFKNRSSLTFTNTNVLRKGNSRNANVSALDLSLYDKKNIYGFFIGGRYSQIWGNDGEVGGYKIDSRYSKVSGKIQYTVGTSIESDTYDPNDLGILNNNNTLDYFGEISYRITDPAKNFLNQRYSIEVLNSHLYKPFKWQKLYVEANAFFLFKNFWDLTFIAESQPLWNNDYFEARVPGRVLRRTPFYFVGAVGSTDSRKKWFVNYFLGGAESPLPRDPFYIANIGFRYRFSDKFQLTLSNNTEADRGNFGFVTFMAGEPIIGRRNINNHTTILSGLYNFTSRMNLSLRMRHFWSKVQYTNVYDLKLDGNLLERQMQNNYDRNFNTFNIDMFYTWDFLLGSRITVAWKNALGSEVGIDGTRYNNYSKNFLQMFNNPHSNEFSIKVVYFLDYLSLKKNARR